MEQTLLVLKPDATMRRGVGAAVFEQILISLPDVKFKGFLEMAVPRHLAEKHYAIHEEKFFYPWLLQFIQVGNVPASVLPKELGVELDDKGYIIVDNAMKTNVKGVFAAGDITTASNQWMQVITACA